MRSPKTRLSFSFKGHFLDAMATDRARYIKRCARVTTVKWGAVVGGGGRRSDSQSRESGFESSCCRFEAWAISFTPRCSISHICINEYLAINNGGYVIEQSSRNNCSLAECFQDKAR